jgi:hypothetical protein
MPTILDYSIGSLGEVKYSRLTEAQFQAIYGTNWVLYDGRSIVGTPLATLLSISTLEDHRALFPRAGNNGRSDGYADPDGDQVAGTNNLDKFLNHSHQETYSPAGGGGPGIQGVGGAGQANTYLFTDGANQGGGNETAGKSMILNAFIRIS